MKGLKENLDNVKLTSEKENKKKLKGTIVQLYDRFNINNKH